MRPSNLILLSALAWTSALAEDEPPVESIHLSCFLSERVDGSVWIEDLSLPPLYASRVEARHYTQPAVRLGAGPARRSGDRDRREGAIGRSHGSAETASLAL